MHMAKNAIPLYSWGGPTSFIACRLRGSREMFQGKRVVLGALRISYATPPNTWNPSGSGNGCHFYWWWRLGRSGCRPAGAGDLRSMSTQRCCQGKRRTCIRRVFWHSKKMTKMKKLMVFLSWDSSWICALSINYFKVEVGTWILCRC